MADRVAHDSLGVAARHAGARPRVRTSVIVNLRRREFGVLVWATDLWFNVLENAHRIRDAGVDDGVFPIHTDAGLLPSAEFFDAIVCIDSFPYFGTEDLYLKYLAWFVKPRARWE